MSETTTFELVTPDRLLDSADAAMVVLPGSEGNLAAMPRHTPVITSLRPGTIDVYATGLSGGVSSQVFVGGGFAEITGDRCVVLAEEAVNVSDIDRTAAEKRLSAANDSLAAASGEGDKAAAEREIAIASALVAAAA